MTWLGWTDAAIAKARAMWTEGKSATEIGRELGVSRSAVLGKLHRLGLTGFTIRKRKSPHRSYGGVVLARTMAARTKKPATVVAEKAPPSLPATPPIDAAPLRLTLLQLQRHQCHAVTDLTAQALYCGHPVRPGSAYCPAHHARFHQGATHEEKKANRMAHAPRVAAEAPAHAAPAVVARRTAKAGG